MSSSTITLSQMEEVVAAISYAADKHNGACRKNSKKQAVITHPLGALSVLLQVGVSDPKVLGATALHDVPEDTNVPVEEIRAKFGDEIASIVAEVTDDRTKSQVERKQEQLAHASKLSEPAVLVKMADMYDNLSSMAEDPPMGWTVEEIQGYMAWKSAIVAQMVGANEKLKDLLQLLFDSSIMRDGKVFPCVPKTPSLEQQLENYFALLAAKEEKKKQKAAQAVHGGMWL